MDELTLDNKKYLSSKKAAQVTGYAKDYVGQLCREGRIEARLVGRNWYVLESSILEHRFGAESEEKQPEPTPEELESTWRTPKYISEPVQTVPELTQKPAYAPSAPVEPAPVVYEPVYEPEPIPEPLPVPEEKQTLADMQEAWKEWFAKEDQREEKRLPDASEMLLEDHEEPSFEVDEPEEELSEAVPVHIERHNSVPRYESRAPQRLADVPINRRYREIEEETEPVRVRRNPNMMPKARRNKVARAAGAHPMILRAVFLAIAAIAVAATIIGVGALDRFTGGKTTTAWTDFLAGTNEVTK